MLRIKKITAVKIVLLFSLIAIPANQVLAIDIGIPVSSSDPLIQDAVSQVVGNGQVVDMKNSMRDQVIDTQSAAKPMRPVLEPMMTTIMQDQIKSQVQDQMMATLSDRNNPDGMVALLAPPVFTQ
ncbi:MAG: hypothetical protein WGN25_14585 [Candidatus Electrothrix sp. GW3-4]|uniref:hypothetical protein n=1 Tax=Candidatus Electrothrix sp. GW3-4 TaxID=3126740 RepID=UPI0030D38662